jgi:glycosyltransferase involved in cell wall biosynthesis
LPSTDAAPPARIAVMPAYNEAPTIEGVLDDLYPRIDRLIIVDDGSRDATPEIVDRWAAGKAKVTVVHFPENRGLSAALRAGWDEVRAMLGRGEVSPRDVAFSIDADGQHEPAALDGMIGHLVSNNYDCVIGSRDLSYHTGYKKLGNAAMTWIGRFAGGQYFEDIECGYRVFRVGPLLEAQEFYRGFKYSETVEVAVILARMGYRVDNTFPINIPVARTRTRLYDAAVDAVCMPLSWYRLACLRDAPPSQRSRLLTWFPVIVFALALAALGLMLLHPFYLGDDSAHSYAHVWYLSKSIFSRHEFPLHVASLENGKAVMFPYGFIPWLPAALLRPITGDWAVTASMVAGVVFLMVAMGRFRAAMRNPVLLGLFLLNPLFWNGITQFQLTTVWAFAFVFLGLAWLERSRTVLAVVGLALAFTAHPLMAAEAVALYGVWELVRTRTLPTRLVGASLVAMLIATPAIYFFLVTPAIHEANRWRLVLSFLDNLRRLSIVLVPLALPPLTAAIYRHQRVFVGAGAVLTAGALIFLPPSGLWESSQPRFAGYLAQHPVQHDGSYRVMTKNNHEDGMFEFMTAGAVLANEFFTESEHRQRFPQADAYVCMLATRGVRHVVISGEYPARFARSERQRLDELVAAGQASLEYTGSDGTVAYAVDPPAAARRESLRDCHL